MSHLRYWVAVTLAYSAFALFAVLTFYIIASVTVIPMYENYHRHGSIFLSPSDANSPKKCIISMQYTTLTREAQREAA